MNNPLDLIKAIKNPKDFAMQLVKNSNNPILNNLVQMAEKGDTQGLETFARNYFKEQGKDFDQIKNSIQ